MRIARSVNCLFSQYIKLSTYEAQKVPIAKLELDNPKFKNALSIDLLNEVQIMPHS